MNTVSLIGRLVKEPSIRYTTGQNQMAVASFTVAVDRPTRGERQADFPSVVVFGRQAETCEKYLTKGSKVAIEGRIQTGKYQNKEGRTVYTTDVVASRVEFVETKRTVNNGDMETSHAYEETPTEQFEMIDEDVPF